jgi:amidohydrolase
MNYKDLAEKTESYIIERRRWFHRHPELSWEEFRTTDEIASELEKMGLKVHRYDGKPGCYADIAGGKAAPGCRTIALRADIDALPVLEKTGLPFASENEGVMHACGHDCHIAMLLGAAKMLVETRGELAGNIRLIFQAAEETSYGAEYFVEQGILDGVDAVAGMHIWGTLDAPYINVQPGRRMASCDIFTITVEGVSTHGTLPHLGVDALVAAASIILNVQTFASRNNDPLNPLVVSIGELHAGQRFNILANRAVMHGTARTFNPEFRKTIEPGLRRIVENTAKALGAQAKLDYRCYCGPIINDDDGLNRVAHDAVAKLYGEEALRDLPMLMGSEDFAYYMDKVPGVFGFIGSRNEALGLTATNHNDAYTVDESVLKRGSAYFAQLAADYLAQD